MCVECAFNAIRLDKWDIILGTNVDEMLFLQITKIFTMETGINTLGQPKSNGSNLGVLDGWIVTAGGSDYEKSARNTDRLILCSKPP